MFPKIGTVKLITMWCGSSSIKNELILVADVLSIPFTNIDKMFAFETVPEPFQAYFVSGIKPLAGMYNRVLAAVVEGVKSISTECTLSVADRLNPDPALVTQARTRLKADQIALFTNIVPEFASALEGRTVAQRAKAAEYFGFDAILISGPVAGVAFSEEDLLAAKSAAKNIPIFANTGVNAQTVAKTLEMADGVISGSAMKIDGKTFNPVDPKRVIELVQAANKSR